jgi:DNA repair exonuclease SbcCD ATPase subunit
MVAIVGIREWLVRPYLEALDNQAKNLSNLKAEVEDLKARLQALDDVSRKVEILEERLKVLDHLLEQEKDNRIWLRSLMKELEEVRLELEGVKLGSAPERSPQFSMSEEEEKQLVLALIRKGAHSPSELKRLAPFGVGKLYRILRELERDGLIRNIGKKKKRKYVPAEAEG